MTLSLRKLLYVAPIFIAVGIAAACGPYIGPICKPPTPASTPTGISMPLVAQSSAPPATPQCTTPHNLPPAPPPTEYPSPTTPSAAQPVPPPAFACPGWNLSIVDGKLHLQTVDGLRSTCEKMTIL